MRKIFRLLVGISTVFAILPVQALVVPGCEGYSVNAEKIYIKPVQDRVILGKQFNFKSKSPSISADGHDTMWRLLYFTPPSTSTITQTRYGAVNWWGDDDKDLTPTHRGINYVSVVDLEWNQCDNEDFLAINGPTISVATTDTSKDGTYAYGLFTMSGTMDNTYAINAVAGLPMGFQVQLKVIGQWTGTRCEVVEETSTWQNAQSLSGLTTFNYVDRCDTQYRFRSYDGEFFSDWTTRMVIGGSTGSGGSSSGGSSSGGSSGGSCPRQPCGIEP